MVPYLQFGQSYGSLKKVSMFFGYFDYFLSLLFILDTVYKETVLYIDMYAFLKTFDNKRNMFLDYDEVLLIFE